MHIGRDEKRRGDYRRQGGRPNLQEISNNFGAEMWGWRESTFIVIAVLGTGRSDI